MIEVRDSKISKNLLEDTNMVLGKICQAAYMSLNKMTEIKMERKQQGKKVGGSHQIG